MRWCRTCPLTGVSGGEKELVDGYDSRMKKKRKKTSDV
jgi:hypothetical protein